MTIFEENDGFQHISMTLKDSQQFFMNFDDFQ